MATAHKRVSVNNYYNYIVIPTVILIACIGVTIPFLVYEEQRLTSKQLMESIRNVLSPSNGNPVLRASAVPDLDASYLPLLIGLVGFIGIIVVIFLQLKVSFVPDFTLLAPIVLAILLTGSLALYGTSFAKLDRNMKILGAMGIAVVVVLFASSVYQTVILKEEKEKKATLK